MMDSSKPNEPDYRALYLHLMHETEAAIRTLVKAQQDCEEAVLAAGDEKTTQD